MTDRTVCAACRQGPTQHRSMGQVVGRVHGCTGIRGRNTMQKEDSSAAYASLGWRTLTGSRAGE